MHRFGTARGGPLDSALADESLGSVQISFHGLQHCDDGVDFFLLFSDDDGQGLLLHVYFWLGCSLVLKERTVLRLRGTVGPHGTWHSRASGGAGHGGGGVVACGVGPLGRYLRFLLLVDMFWVSPIGFAAFFSCKTKAGISLWMATEMCYCNDDSQVGSS